MAYSLSRSLLLVTLVAGCSSETSGGTNAGTGGKSSTDGGGTPDSGHCLVKPGTPNAPTVANGHFDNGVLSGFGRTWLQDTTALSSISSECDAGSDCASSGLGICAEMKLESGDTSPAGLARGAVGIGINQGTDRAIAPLAWAPQGKGLYVKTSSSSLVRELEVQIRAAGADTDPTKRWCASLAPNMAAAIPWTSFAECDKVDTAFYSPTIPLTSVDIVAFGNLDQAPFELCLVDAVPYGLPADILSCDGWYRYPIPGTSNVLINNVWNAQHAGAYAYKQCLIKRCTEEGEKYGWTWDWPPLDLTTSFAAPEVVFGRKPWDGGASTSQDLPKRIDAISNLTLDYSVNVMAEPSYNLNATMWLTQTEAASSAPDPQNIVAEVMVRFDNPGGVGACCTVDGSVRLGGIEFDVWHQDAHADASGGSSYTWKMVIYNAKERKTEGQFDLALVLQDMVAKGLAQSTNGVQGVELITEVSGGKGEVWLNRFGVTVR